MVFDSGIIWSNFKRQCFTELEIIWYFDGCQTETKETDEIFAIKMYSGFLFIYLKYRIISNNALWLWIK